MNPKDCMRSKEEMKLLADIAGLEAENQRLREALLGIKEYSVCECRPGWICHCDTTPARIADEALNHGIKKDGG